MADVRQNTKRKKQMECIQEFENNSRIYRDKQFTETLEWPNSVCIQYVFITTVRHRNKDNVETKIRNEVLGMWLIKRIRFISWGKKMKCKTPRGVGRKRTVKRNKKKTHEICGAH